MNDDNHESEQDHEQREEQGKHEERKQRRNEESEVQSSEQEGKRFGHDATDISKGEIGGTTDSQDSEVPPFDQEPVGDTDASEIEAETHRGQSSDAHVPQIEIEDQAKVDGRRLEDTVTVEGEDGVVEIPAFEVEDASQVSSIQLASTVSIEAEDDYTVPVPQVETDDVVDRTGRELDEDVPMIDQEKAIHIPQIHISNFEPIKPYARLLREPPVARTETVADEIEATEEIVEEEETELPSEITDVESGAAASETGETSSSAGLEEEWPEPLELLFGGGGGEISSDEPVVLCVDDKEGEDFVAILETLVQRLYREKVGGQPDPSRFGDAQELVNETRWVEAEHKIFTAKFDDDEWDTLRGDLKEEWNRIWKNRVLNELYAQDFGAIIFNQQFLLSPEDHYPKIIQLTPSSLSPSTQESLIRLFWGYWDASPADDQTFGHLFNFYGERVIKNQWAKIENAENSIFLDAAEPDESAGHHHRRMKVFVIKWLVERLRDQGYELETPIQIKEVVKPEKEYKQEEDTLAIADVFCEAVDQSPKGVFEVETLYAEDRASGKSRDKLRETFTKYEYVDAVNEINIVLDNLSTMLHLKTIAELKHNHRDWEKQHGKEVNFYTLDLKNQEIVRIESVIEDMKELEEEISLDPV